MNIYCFDCNKFGYDDNPGHDTIIFDDSNRNIIEDDERSFIDNLAQKLGESAPFNNCTDSNTDHGWTCKKCSFINLNLKARECASCHHFSDDFDIYEKLLTNSQQFILKFGILESSDISNSVPVEVVMDRYSSRNEEFNSWRNDDIYKYSFNMKKIMSSQLQRSISDEFHELLKSKKMELQNAYAKWNKDISVILHRSEALNLDFKLNINDLIPICVNERDFKAMVCGQPNSQEDHLQRKLMVECYLKSKDKLKHLVELIKIEDIGNNENCTLKDIVDVVKLTSDFSIMQHLLLSPCDLCCGIFPSNKFVNMIVCSHNICSECFISTFSQEVINKNPDQWNCPFCDKINDPECQKLLYNLISCRFNLYVENHKDFENVIEKFEIKLLESGIKRVENFIWCPNDECDFGYETSGNGVNVCIKCQTKVCGKCRRKYQSEHESMTCDEYSLFLLKSDKDLQKLFTDIGIECSNCSMRYAVAIGGCLHFECKKCNSNFCGGCSSIFIPKDSKCNFKTCTRTDFHAHHPRNCQYYIRDGSVEFLQSMLINQDIQYPKDNASKTCTVKVTSQDMKETNCPEPNCQTTGSCENHYKEFLIKWINQLVLDPADFKTNVKELNLMLTQSLCDPLTKGPKESHNDFILRLRKTIKENCELYQRRFN